MKKLILYLFVLMLCLSSLLVFQKRSLGQDEVHSKLIRKDRPSIYIEFERSGNAPPLFENEKDQRIWLRLHNNAKWAISFCSFSVKSQYGDTGIVYDIKHDSIIGIGKSSTENWPDDEIQRRAIQALKGYSTGDTCNVYTLMSGKSVVFSLPREHIGKNLYIQIEFWPEWENRDNELGNFPQYYVSFGNQELPRNER